MGFNNGCMMTWSYGREGKEPKFSVRVSPVTVGILLLRSFAATSNFITVGMPLILKRSAIK